MHVGIFFLLVNLFVCIVPVLRSLVYLFFERILKSARMRKETQGQGSIDHLARHTVLLQTAFLLPTYQKTAAWGQLTWRSPHLGW